MARSPRTPARRARLPALLALSLFACGAEGDDEHGDESVSSTQSAGEANDGTPRGADECYAQYFTKLSAECATTDCGEALTCVTDWDCLTCADRCETESCGSDADCEAAYGHLCAEVEWRCEPYIVADDLRCTVHELGESRCGDDVCSADETCDSCHDDCGYCPGTAPAMAPCSADGDCQSGVCAGWCVQGCSSGWDCVGDGTGTLYGSCVVASDDNAYCFPSCSVDGDCAVYPGTSCMAGVNNEGFDTTVCAG